MEKLTYGKTWPPVLYTKNYFPNPDGAFQMLWEELEWVKKENTPRIEYYCNDIPANYSYGNPLAGHDYEPQPWHPKILEIKTQLEYDCNCKFEVCFVNGYRDGSDSLGWHADDSPEMDDARAIAIVSFGASREIYFRPQEDKTDITKIWLESGSLCLMLPGMQDTHFHKIPKSSVHNCGPRISLTFRGYNNGLL
jgi:alkylated DNA repair dioxygenase AlkB